MITTRNHPSTDQQSRTVAFIDANNLHQGISRLGWRLDYGLFRDFLFEEYGVRTAMLFIGYIPEHRYLYDQYKALNYSLVFRAAVRTRHGIKANCDTDLAVQVVAGCCEDRYDKAVLVSGDGDFAPLCSFLANRGKLAAVVAPSHRSVGSNQYRQYCINVTILQSFRAKLERKSIDDLGLSMDAFAS